MKLKALIFSLSILTMNVLSAQDLKTENDQLSYAYGILIAEQMTSQGVKDLNTELVAAALKAQMDGTNSAMSPDKARMVIGEFQNKKQAGIAQENKLKGAAFLAENGRKEGVTTTASGLQYEVINSGDGETPTATSTVKTHYHGTLIDGTVFDSSVQRGEPISFPVNGVIKGWTEALQLMKVGDKWRLFIPSDLAYGAQGAGGAIGPHSALIFEVELLGVE